MRSKISHATTLELEKTVSRLIILIIFIYSLKQSIIEKIKMSHLYVNKIT